MNLNNLSIESQAAFILAIVFTIISIAGAIIFFRREDSGNVIKILTAVVFPFVAIFCWVYMLLNILAKFDIGTSFYSAFLITLGFFAIVFAIYFIAVNAEERKKAKEEEERKEQEEKYLQKLESDVQKLQKKVDEREDKETQKALKTEPKKTKKA